MAREKWKEKNKLGALVSVWYECRICNREVAGSYLGRGYFAPRSTQPSIPPGSLNEYQLRLGWQMQVWVISIADEAHGVQVKLCYPLTMHAVPDRLRDASCGGPIQIDYLTFKLIFKRILVH